MVQVQGCKPVVAGEKQLRLGGLGRAYASMTNDPLSKREPLGGAAFAGLEGLDREFVVSDRVGIGCSTMRRSCAQNAKLTRA